MGTKCDFPFPNAGKREYPVAHHMKICVLEVFAPSEFSFGVYLGSRNAERNETKVSFKICPPSDNF